MSQSRTLWATLIGINAYKKSPLSGCVKDVLDIDLLLREQSSQQTNTLIYKPKYLLAPNETDNQRISKYQESQNVTIDFEQPTFDNITKKAFAHLKNAQDGDICFFYYSGHGSYIDAPEVFWYSKPDKQNETIVCLDSRNPDNPDSRDLIDKELAYLIWDALKGKDVHALMIMDSCHSGNATRGMDDQSEGLKFRFQPSSKKTVPIENYLGFSDPDFYKIDDGKARIKIARYVHLAAARDVEKAQETMTGGLFTSKLVESLRSGGTSKSYRELMQGLSITVRNRNAQQNPVAFARENADLDQQFLGRGIVPYKPSFEVRYDFARDRWIMNGGSIHGIFPSVGEIKTLVEIKNTGNVSTQIAVEKVFADNAILNTKNMAGFDKSLENYVATLVRLANPLLKIGISKELLANEELLNTIKTAYSDTKHAYYEIDFTENSNAYYLIDFLQENNFVLVQQNSRIPLFKREAEATTFLEKVDMVGLWTNALELKNPITRFKKGDFIFSLERIEGKLDDNADWDILTGEKLNLQPDQEIIFSYQKELPPGFRLSISIAPESSLISCFVGVLYLDSKYGIMTNLIEKDASQVFKNGNSVNLSFDNAGRLSSTIPLYIDEEYSVFNINEITEYLKIFVSSKPLDLDRYKQASLELDGRFFGPDRGIGVRGDTKKETDWTIYDFRFRIVGPAKDQILEAGTANDFSAFTIDVPDGFTAKAFAATGEDVLRKIRSTQLRGADDDTDSLVNNIVPPASIWGNAVTEAAFTSGLASAADNEIQVLELQPVNGRALQLPEGKSLVIRPKNLRFVSRSIDDDFEDVVIPFGFDEASQLFFPIGSSDEQGNIHIDFLPAESAGQIQGEGELTRSLGGSFKMFFKKLFKRKSGFNTLVLYGFNEDGTWKELTRNPSGMEDFLKTRPNKKVILLTHGLTGDTRHMVGALEVLPELADVAGFVLTYDYENLSTPIDDAAKALHKALKDAGFGKSNIPKITIIAHSQGGLLTRWLVEQAGGNEYVDQLILVAGASAGSELAKLGSSIFGLLTHAINVTGPIKLVITGLSFLLKALKSDPGRTLKDTAPNSRFIENLGRSRQTAGVKYNVIIGDTALIQRNYDGDDTFLQKLKKALAENLVIPGLTHNLFGDQANDIAVTVHSATFITGYDSTRTKIVASNHLAYFREKLVQKELIEFLRGSSDS